MTAMRRRFMLLLPSQMQRGIAQVGGMLLVGTLVFRPGALDK